MLKAMRQKDSPLPRFEADEDRIFFLVTLCVHPHSIGEAEQRKH